MNWGDIILLACAAAVYPTLLAGVILILGQPHPLRMLIAFLVGGMTISIAAGFGIYQGLTTSGAVSQTHRSSRPIADIVIGAISLLVAWGVATNRIKRSWFDRFRRRPRKPAKPEKPSLTSRALSGGSASMALAAGVVLNVPGIWYLDALSEIAHAKPSTGTAIAAILVFNVIMFTLVEFPIVAYVLDPQAASDRVNALSRSFHQHARGIGISVATIVGAWLIAKGIVNLV